MITWAPKDAALKRTLPAVLGMVAALLVATACTSGSGAAPAASPAAFSGSGLAHAKAEAREFEMPTTAFLVRTQKLGSVASLHGNRLLCAHFPARPAVRHHRRLAQTGAAGGRPVLASL
jgi:hypothetical protein